MDKNMEEFQKVLQFSTALYNKHKTVLEDILSRNQSQSIISNKKPRQNSLEKDEMDENNNISKLLLLYIHIHSFRTARG